MAKQLQEDGQAVELNGVVVRTPGLSGTIEVRETIGIGETRAAIRGAGGEATDALVEALQNARTQEMYAIELGETQEVPMGAEGARRGPDGEPSIEVTVPAPAENWGQLILASDEAGVVSWHFPRNEANEIETTRGGATLTYVIPRRVLPADNALAESRGLIGTVGTKLLKVLVFPLLDPFIGKVGAFFVRKWEARNRPYGIRTFTPGNYTRPAGEAIMEEGWDTLSEARSLLFIHGTFSRAHSAFGALDVETMETLHARYAGRVFALDHPTLSDDPEANVTWFLEQLPATAKLDLDIICHSRGGLVSRTLAKQGNAENGAQVSVGRIVFVAAPNAGTILTNAKHIGEFIDTYTNLLQLFPDNGVTDVLEAVIAVAKQLAVGVLDGLEGLQSMLPGGKVLGTLDAAIPANARYFALASNFEPAPDSRIAMRAADKVVDKAFEGAKNDLVVPTDGVFRFGPALGGFGQDPAARMHVFDGANAPVHTRFFGEKATRDAILAWLT